MKGKKVISRLTKVFYALGIVMLLSGMMLSAITSPALAQEQATQAAGEGEEETTSDPTATPVSDEGSGDEGSQDPTEEPPGDEGSGDEGSQDPTEEPPGDDGSGDEGSQDPTEEPPGDDGSGDDGSQNPNQRT